MNKEDEKYIQDLIAKGNLFRPTSPIEALIMAGYIDPTINSDTVKKLEEIADREFARLMLEKDEKNKTSKTPKTDLRFPR